MRALNSFRQAGGFCGPKAELYTLSIFILCCHYTVSYSTLSYYVISYYKIHIGLEVGAAMV